MRKLITLSALVLIALFTVSAVPQKPQTWEYKFDYKCSEKHANEFAAQGWELATHSSSPIASAIGSSGSLEICIFKRPK